MASIHTCAAFAVLPGIAMTLSGCGGQFCAALASIWYVADLTENFCDKASPLADALDASTILWSANEAFEYGHKALNLHGQVCDHAPKVADLAGFLGYLGSCGKPKAYAWLFCEDPDQADQNERVRHPGSRAAWEGYVKLTAKETSDFIDVAATERVAKDAATSAELQRHVVSPNRVVPNSQDEVSCALKYGMGAKACDGELSHLSHLCCCPPGHSFTEWNGGICGEDSVRDTFFPICDKFAFIHTASSMSTVSGVMKAFLEEEHNATIEVYSEFVPDRALWSRLWNSMQHFIKKCGLGLQWTEYTILDSAAGTNVVRNCMLAFALTTDWEAEEVPDVAMSEQGNLSKTVDFVA